jgi:branched-chain amino acid transport system substrate-binding protein
MYTVANAIKKAKSTDTEALIAALRGMEMDTPIGPIVWRALDHQSTMGAYVGRLAKKDGKGTMVDWKFAPGEQYLPPFEQVRAWRRD